MGLQPGDLDVRDLGYRWGSLGKSDRLNIHWAAMQLPVSLLDYVIVHELAHIGSPVTPPPSGPRSSVPSPTTISAEPASPPPAPLSGSAEGFLVPEWLLGRDPRLGRRMTSTHELGGAAKAIAINVATEMLEHRLPH